MNKIFDSIRQMDEAGQEYWSARELASVIGYADYRNFSKIIDKAKVLCVQNNKSVEDHFVEVNEMVTIGSEAKRKLKSYHLSRYACLLISMSLSSRKENALPALEYFSGKQNLSSSSSSNPQPIGFRGNLLVKRQKFFYCTYSLGITETS